MGHMGTLWLFPPFITNFWTFDSIFNKAVIVLMILSFFTLLENKHADKWESLQLPLPKERLEELNLFATRELTQE